MLDAGNPYVLPSVLVGAAVYLGLTVASDASLPVRIGALVVLAGVVPVALNRLLGDRSGPADFGDGEEAPAATAGDDAGDEGTR